MVVAITDANVFIDLIEIDMLHCLFNLGLEVHTTYEVFSQLNFNQSQAIECFVQDNSLKLHSFTYEELLEIEAMHFPPGLEMADRTVFYYAKKINGVILSGDRKLKRFCERHHHTVRGVIWIFDKVLESGFMSSSQLASKMELLISINPRLPMDECMNRIAKWHASN